jgi:hypothetical protein
MAAATVVLKRSRVASLNRLDSNITPRTIPEEKLWVASFQTEMLMLDGYP